MFNDQRKGFYVAVDNDTGAIGISVAIVYMEEENDIQFCIQIGTLAIAVGISL